MTPGLSGQHESDADPTFGHNLSLSCAATDTPLTLPVATQVFGMDKRRRNLAWTRDPGHEQVLCYAAASGGSIRCSLDDPALGIFLVVL